MSLYSLFFSISIAFFLKWTEHLFSTRSFCIALFLCFVAKIMGIKHIFIVIRVFIFIFIFIFLMWTRAKRKWKFHFSKARSLWVETKRAEKKTISQCKGYYSYLDVTNIYTQNKIQPNIPHEITTKQLLLWNGSEFISFVKIVCYKQSVYIVEQYCI